MNGTTYERCTTCKRRVNGAQARAAHKASGCAGTRTTWVLKADLGRDAEGKRRQRLVAGFATEAQAQRELREMLTAVDQGRYVEPSRATLQAYLQDTWLPSTVPSTRYGTFEKRRLHVGYVAARIGSTPLHQVTPLVLERLYADLLRSGGRNSRPLSRATVLDVSRTLHAAFAAAVRWQALTTNPCSVARVPQGADADVAIDPEDVWNAVQVQAFLEATRRDALGPLYATALHTGMRLSEMLALRWDAVDLGDSPTLHVRATITRGPEGYRETPATKTAGSRRTIEIDPALAERLEEARKAQLKGRRPSPYVFPGRDGGFRAPKTVSRTFRDRVAGLRQAEPFTLIGLPPIPFRNLRHTCASVLLNAEEPLTNVSRLLGHASPVTTMRFYARMVPNTGRKTASKAARLMFGTGA